MYTSLVTRGKGSVPEPDICFCLVSQGMDGSLCHTRVDRSARQYISRNLKSDVSISINTVNMVSCSLATSWFPRWLRGKESACQCRRCMFNLWVRKTPWERAWQPTPEFLSEESQGQRSLEGYSLWGHKESGTNERQTLQKYQLEPSYHQRVNSRS